MKPYFQNAAQVAEVLGDLDTVDFVARKLAGGDKNKLVALTDAIDFANIADASNLRDSERNALAERLFTLAHNG